MDKQPDLFGKTFDTQVKLSGGNLQGKDIWPNRIIPGEVVLELVLNGVRVTARDSHHRILWGFIGSKDMLTNIYCPVAIYETLQELIGEELQKHTLPHPDSTNPMLSAKWALDELQKTIDRLKESINVKNVSEATEKKASVIARAVKDAVKVIDLEISLQ